MSKMSFKQKKEQYKKYKAEYIRKSKENQLKRESLHKELIEMCNAINDSKEPINLRQVLSKINDSRPVKIIFIKSGAESQKPTKVLKEASTWKIMSDLSKLRVVKAKVPKKDHWWNNTTLTVKPFNNENKEKYNEKEKLI